MQFIFVSSPNKITNCEYLQYIPHMQLTRSPNVVNIALILSLKLFPVWSTSLRCIIGQSAIQLLFRSLLMSELKHTQPASPLLDYQVVALLP